MPIAIRCPLCGRPYHLADEQAGRRVRCRECKCEFDVAGLPERLEVVEALNPLPVGMLPDQDVPVVPQLVRRGPNNRALLVVLIGTGVCLTLSLLTCAGVVSWVVLQPNPPIKVVVGEPERPPAPPPAAPPAAPPGPVAVPQVEGIGIGLNLPGVGMVLGPAPKNLDDALAMLKSPNLGPRMRALEYLGRQKVPAEPAKRKVVLDAVEPLTNSDDVFVRAAAGQVKLLWGGFD